MYSAEYRRNVKNMPECQVRELTIKDNSGSWERGYLIPLNQLSWIRNELLLAYGQGRRDGAEARDPGDREDISEDEKQKFIHEEAHGEVPHMPDQR